MKAKGTAEPAWKVYMLECADGTLYTGVTNDLARRVEEHNGLSLGAKYTRSRRPVALRYAQECESKGAALREEMRLKKMRREEKLELIRTVR